MNESTKSTFGHKVNDMKASKPYRACLAAFCATILVGALIFGIYKFGDFFWRSASDFRDDVTSGNVNKTEHHGIMAWLINVAIGSQNITRSMAGVAQPDILHLQRSDASHFSWTIGSIVMLGFVFGIAL